MASTRFTVEYEPVTGDIDVFFNYVKNMDTGPYKCRADNIYGFDVTEATFFIIDGPNIDERPQTVNPEKYDKLDKPTAQPEPNLENALELQPPIVIIPLKDTKIVEETPVELLAKIIGNPKPKVFSIKIDFSRFHLI
jgi:hypothetical protein